MNHELSKDDASMSGSSSVLAWKLEKELSQMDCLHYETAILDFF
jgi:hypothetical protein